MTTDDVDEGVWGAEAFATLRSELITLQSGERVSADGSSLEDDPQAIPDPAEVFYLVLMDIALHVGAGNVLGSLRFVVRGERDRLARIAHGPDAPVVPIRKPPR